MPFLFGRIAILPSLLLLLGWSSPAAENESSPTDLLPKPEWSIDDLLSTESSSDWDRWSISPDCHWAAWIKIAPNGDKDDRFFGTLHLSSLKEKKEIQLTRNGSCNTPKWSPDGRSIAFISSRPETTAKSEAKTNARIWLINPFGGEPWPLTDGDQLARSFSWADAHTIIYSAQEEAASLEQSKNKKDTARVVEDKEHEVPVRLFKIDVDAKKVTHLIENNDQIDEFAVSPDGTQVVTVQNRSPRYNYDKSVAPVAYLINLKTGLRKQIFTEIRFPPLKMLWQRDSRAVYATTSHASSSRYDYPCSLDLAYYDLATGIAKSVDLGWEKGLAASDLLVITRDGFIAPLANGVRPKYARFWRDGNKWQREWLTGLHATNLFGCEIGSDDKTILYDYSDASHPSQWYRATLNHAKIESPTQITRLNPQFQKKQMAKYETIHWKGALGETVEGLLYYPLDYQAGKKYPLLAELHGGPVWSFDDRWPTWLNPYLFNSRGMFVFRPNYHGSAGYGLKWAESNIGRLNDLEVEDINTGVDYLVDRGLADPEKLAVMGWSNGGTLTAAVTVNTNRYKAAIAGAGPIDWIDDWAKSDIGAWFCKSYLGKNPLNDPATLMRHSPFYQLNKVTTPTLIFFGADDQRVPIDQGWMYYRALQQAGKTDVRFIIFPGEGHGITKVSDERRILEEELAWFDKYLLQSNENISMGR